jgi:hypothetical protein
VGGGQEAVFTIRGLFLEYFGDIQREREREIDREVMAIFLFWERNFGFLFFLNYLVTGTYFWLSRLRTYLTFHVGFQTGLKFK